MTDLDINISENVSLMEHLLSWENVQQIDVACKFINNYSRIVLCLCLHSVKSGLFQLSEYWMKFLTSLKNKKPFLS